MKRSGRMARTAGDTGYMGKSAWITPRPERPVHAWWICSVGVDRREYGLPQSVHTDSGMASFTCLFRSSQRPRCGTFGVLQIADGAMVLWPLPAWSDAPQRVD